MFMRYLNKMYNTSGVRCSILRLLYEEYGRQLSPGKCSIEWCDILFMNSVLLFFWQKGMKDFVR